MERLQKVIANAGVCSRRKAEELILQGKVSVNGDIVRTLGTKVSSSDEVLVNGKAINITKLLYDNLLIYFLNFFTLSFFPYFFSNLSLNFLHKVKYYNHLSLLQDQLLVLYHI